MKTRIIEMLRIEYPIIQVERIMAEVEEALM